MLLNIIFTILLVLLNGFFVAAEFAIVKVRASQIEQKVKEGHRFASMAKGIVRQLDSYLSATQLGITLASLGLGWVGEKVVAEIVLDLLHKAGMDSQPETAHAIALPIAFALITMMHIVFGELAPKSLAIQNSVGTTLAVALPLKVFYKIFWPFIKSLNWLSNLFLRMIGIHPASELEVHTPQELLYILEQSRSGGMIRSSEHKILENVFDFYDRPARAIMVPRIDMEAVPDTVSIIDIKHRIKEKGYSRLPVYKDTVDNIIGIINAKDLLTEEIGSGITSLGQVMRPPWLIPETKPIGKLLREMQHDKVHIAILVDEFGGTAGLITLEDILEELVGEIQDEYDMESPWVSRLTENEYIVKGNASVMDANERLPLELPEGDDYETVGGYVYMLFGKIPTVKESIRTEDYEITVLTKLKNRIESVKLLLLSSKDSEEAPLKQ